MTNLNHLLQAFKVVDAYKYLVTKVIMQMESTEIIPGGENGIKFRSNVRKGLHVGNKITSQQLIRPERTRGSINQNVLITF